ncbi:MAG: hypothetical protein ACM3Q4_00595 [Acidobacteriota bacterium]
MDVDEFKKRVQHIKAPAAADAAPDARSGSVPDLLALLKQSDEKKLRQLRRGRIFLGIATAVFIGAFALTWLSAGSSEAARTERLLQRGSMALIYCFVIGLFFIEIRKLSRVNYALPVKEFLAQAERRYRFMTPGSSLLAALGLLVVGGLAGAAYVPYLSRVFGFTGSYMPMSAIFAAFILAVAAMGMAFTKKDWKRDRAGLWHHIRQMQRELEQM